MDSAVLRALLGMPRISLADKEGATQAAKDIHAALVPHAPKAHIERDPTSDGWRLRLEKMVHGNKVETVIDHAFVEGGDYARIVTTAQTLSGLIGRDAQVKRGETVRSIRSFKEGLDWLLGGQGFDGDPALQGPGRDEPRAALGNDDGSVKRILLKVQIEDAITRRRDLLHVDGRRVEPRRQFIETNALGVMNLDVCAGRTRMFR
jgi:DNA gyrase subunit B